MNALLYRHEYGDKQTLGTLMIFDGLHKVYECKCLELAWRNNERNISCIPEGEYMVRKRKAEESPSRDYDHFIVEGTEPRTYILWHSGNYYYDIAGCLLMGQYFKDINKDGLLDVAKTRYTIDLLYKILPDRFKFRIVSK